MVRRERSPQPKASMDAAVGRFFCLDDDLAQSTEMVHKAAPGGRRAYDAIDDDVNDDMEGDKEDVDDEDDTPVEALKKARERNRQLAERIWQLEAENAALKEKDQASTTQFPLNIFG